MADVSGRRPGQEHGGHAALPVSTLRAFVLADDRLRDLAGTAQSLASAHPRDCSAEKPSTSRSIRRPSVVVTNGSSRSSSSSLWHFNLLCWSTVRPPQAVASPEYASFSAPVQSSARRLPSQRPRQDRFASPVAHTDRTPLVARRKPNQRQIARRSVIQRMRSGRRTAEEAVRVSCRQIQQDRQAVSQRV